MTVFELILKLAAIAGKGGGEKQVVLEGCACDGEWNGIITEFPEVIILERDA
jgi:hypothetical protein